MNPIKVVGGVLVLLGVIFRAISLAYFNLKLKTLPDTPQARRRFETKRRNALIWDVLFIGAGFYVILRG